MTSSQIIVLAIPVFLALIVMEIVWGWAKGRNTYRFNDAVNSLSLGMLSQISAVFTRLLRVGIYTLIYTQVALYPDYDFWTTWYGWLLALVFYDFCYYWLHRAGHEVAVFWAAHVVHHQSQDYNLSTALRQTSSGALLGWVFYVPMAVAGVPPLVFAVVALVDLLYQYWVHTEHVKKLGWFDRWFCSPSNHRVHHAVNDQYLDRNYGGILIVWDRLFGSFKEEGDKCVYGTRKPLASWDPLWANVDVYWSLLQDSWRTRRWADKLRVWFKPPGWRPADVAARFPHTPFELSRVAQYHPPMNQTTQLFSGVSFAVLLLGVVVFLWFAEGLVPLAAAMWLGVLVTCLWAIGAVMQGRLGTVESLMIASAALATTTSVLELTEMHRVFKPLTMIFAIHFVATHIERTSGTRKFSSLLLGGLLFSLVGDSFLMFDGYFVPGLVSFLIAHLFYIALLKQQQAWFPSTPALVAVLLIGGGMYAVLWFGGLPVALRAPVAAYVVVIGLMAAQAIGRATVVRDGVAWGVALGAGLFMVSDTLLAVNRFVSPLPLAQLWVLSTYYLAQVLIVRNAVAATHSPPFSCAATTSIATRCAR